MKVWVLRVDVVVLGIAGILQNIVDNKMDGLNCSEPILLLRQRVAETR